MAKSSAAPKLAKVASPAHAEDRYRAEDDLRTVTRADEVRRDPKRMANVRAIHRTQLSALSQVGRSIHPRGAGKPTARKRTARRRTAR